MTPQTKRRLTDVAWWSAMIAAVVFIQTPSGLTAGGFWAIVLGVVWIATRNRDAIAREDAEIRNELKRLRDENERLTYGGRTKEEAEADALLKWFEQEERAKKQARRVQPKTPEQPPSSPSN